MNKRAKKVQKRKAKKAARTKKPARTVEESVTLALKFARENERYQAMLTKSIIIDVLVNDKGESLDDCSLYFEIIESEFKVDFDKAKVKPKPAMMHTGIDDTSMAPWLVRFISKLGEKYGDHELAGLRAFDIYFNVEDCLNNAKAVMKKKSPEVFEKMNNDA